MHITQTRQLASTSPRPWCDVCTALALLPSVPSMLSAVDASHKSTCRYTNMTYYPTNSCCARSAAAAPALHGTHHNAAAAHPMICSTSLWFTPVPKHSQQTTVPAGTHRKTAQHREVPARMASSACQASRFCCRWLLQLLQRMLRHEDICEQCHCVCCCDTKSVDCCNAHALPASRHIAAAAGGGTGCTVCAPLPLHSGHSFGIAGPKPALNLQHRGQAGTGMRHRGVGHTYQEHQLLAAMHINSALCPSAAC
jgi:hypothetical protein